MRHRREGSKVVGTKMAASIAFSVISWCKLLIQIPLLRESVPCVIMTKPGIWNINNIPSSISKRRIFLISWCNAGIGEELDDAIKYVTMLSEK